MLSYHFLNQTTRDNFFTNESSHGAGQLWSNLHRDPMFEEYSVPLPLIIFDSIPSGTKMDVPIPHNIPVYEVRRYCNSVLFAH